MKSNKSLTKNSLFYIIYNILNIVFPFVTGVYAARILLPDDIGMIESARNLVQYFVILSFLGIPTYGLREISKNRNDKDELNKIYSELIIINFISTCFFGIVYLIIINSIPAYRDGYILYLLTGMLIFLNIFNNSWLYEGLEEFKYITIRNLIFKIVSFIILILFVKDTNDYLIYASINIIGTAGNYILNIIHSRKIVKLTTKNLNFKRHMKSIIYLVVVNLAIEIYMLLDITMLSFLCEKSKVAYYSYGMKIYRILYQIINTFTIVVVPRLALLFKENKKQFDELLTKTYKIVLIIAIPMILGIFAVSDYIICLLYGKTYLSSSYVLKILSISLVISPTGYLLGSRVMLITNNEKKMVIPVAIGALTNIILNSLFIIKFNEIGAAAASVISEFIVMIVYILISKKYFKLVNIMGTIKKIIISSIILLIYLLLMSFITHTLIMYIIDIVGAIAIYSLSLIILKEKIVIEFLEKFKCKIMCSVDNTIKNAK